MDPSIVPGFNSISMENDKVFNLQLIIQKLEEELHLYRNGTTGSELLGIINEKDKEIDHLTELLFEKNEKFKKLKGTSQDVLHRCDGLQSENDKKQEMIVSLESKMRELEQTISSLQVSISQLEYEKEELLVTNAEQSDLIAQMEVSDHENNEVIDKLQRRMASLLQEKFDRAKAVESEIAALLREIDIQKQRCTELQDLGEQLRQEKLTLKTKFSSLEDFCASQGRECQELRMKLVDMEKQNKEMNAKDASQTSKLQTLEQQLVDEKRRLACKDAALEASEEKNRTDVAAIQRLMVEVSRLEVK